MDEILKKKKCPELVTSLFELQDMLLKTPVLVLPFESGNCGKRMKKTTKNWIEEKNIFQNL